MKILFSARKFEASAKLQQFAEKELDHLEKYFDGSMHGEIVLEESGSIKSVDIRLKVLSSVLTAKMDGDDFYKMIPKVVVKLERQLKDLKTKIQNR